MGPRVAVGDQVLLKESPTGYREVYPKVHWSVRDHSPGRKFGLSLAIVCSTLIEGNTQCFHVSMLGKYLRNPELKIDLEHIRVEQDFKVEYDVAHILLESLEGHEEENYPIIQYVKVL